MEAWPSPLQLCSPSVGFLEVELLFRVEGFDVRRPLLACSVGVVVDVERGGGLSGKGRREAEAGSNPAPAAEFDVGRGELDGSGGAMVPGGGELEGAVPD